MNDPMISANLDTILEFIREYLETKRDLLAVERIVDKLTEHISTMDDSGDTRGQPRNVQRSVSLSIDVRGASSERLKRISSKIASIGEKSLTAQYAQCQLSEIRSRLESAVRGTEELTTLVKMSDASVVEAYSLDPKLMEEFDPGRLSMANLSLDEWLRNHQRVSMTMGLIKRISEFFMWVFKFPGLLNLDGPGRGGHLHDGLERLGIILSDRLPNDLVQIVPQIRKKMVNKVLEGSSSNTNAMDEMEDDFFFWVLGATYKIWDVISLLYRARIVLNAFANPVVFPNEEQYNAVRAFLLLLETLMHDISVKLKEIGVEVNGADIRLLETPHEDRNDRVPIPYGDSPLMNDSLVVKYLKTRIDSLPPLCYMDIATIGYRTTQGRRSSTPLSLYRLDKSMLV